MSEFRTIPPKLTKYEWNALLDHGLEKPCSFIIFKRTIDGTDYYYAQYGTGADQAGKIAFGGPNNAGNVNGTDASAVIQSAINALTPGRTWKEKVVLKGNFTVTKQDGKSYAIGLPSYTILEIVGKIRLANNQNCDVIANIDQSGGNHYIEIIGGIIDGNKANQTTAGSGIKLKASPTNWAGPYCYRNVVKDVHVNNCKEYGFRFEACNDLMVTNCYSGEVGGPGSGYDGYYIDSCHEVFLVGCHSIENGRDGYRVASTLPSGTWENLFTDCGSENNGAWAYHFLGTPVACTLVSCTCDDCPSGGVYVEGGEEITISGNSLARGTYGIRVAASRANVVGNSIREVKQGVRVEASGVNVVGNRIHGKKENEEYGVYLASDVNNCLVAGNLITYISANYGDQAGILLYGNNNYNTIVANKIFDVARFGIRLAANAASSYNNIVDNHIDTCATGIGINGAHTYNHVSKNMVRNPVYNCITLWNGADYNQVVDNILYGPTTIHLSAAGPNNVIKRNFGFITENSGTATIAAGATYVDVTHGLAVTPSLQKIKLTPLDDLAGRSLWVSNPTSTTFRINMSSADSVSHNIGWSYEE